MVTLLSLIPAPSLPGVGLWDKLQHALAYLALAFTGAIAFPDRRRHGWLCLGLLVLGASLEGLQSLIPGRFGSVEDMLANAVGVGLGLALARIFNAGLRFG